MLKNYNVGCKILSTRRHQSTRASTGASVDDECSAVLHGVLALTYLLYFCVAHAWTNSDTSLLNCGKCTVAGICNLKGLTALQAKFHLQLLWGCLQKCHSSFEKSDIADSI